jgi:type I restriction enzyme S subunit
MNEGWELTTLGKLTSWKSGGTPSKSKNEFWGGDIPWISASSMGGNRYSNSKLKVTQLGVENGAKLAKKNNLLLLVRGSILHQKIQVGIATRDLTFNQDVKALTVREDVDPWFILAWLRGNEWSLLNMVENTGIGAGKLDTTLLQNLPLHLPPIEVRKQITLFFKTIDDKIHLLRQQNATLESMAQALFKSWFVDFDPVIDNALAAGRVLPEALGVRVALRGAVLASGKYAGLPEAVKRLFPEGFVFSEDLGRWVPEGWEVGPVSSFAEVVGGGTPSTKVDEYFSEEGIPWLSPKDLSGYEWKYISGGAKDITQAGLKNSSAKLLPIGTILFSSRAPIGYIAVALNELCTNQGFKSLVPNNDDAIDYMYNYLKRYTPDLEAIATGSTFKEVSGGALKDFEILMPAPNALEAFADMVGPWNEKLAILQEEVSTLTRLRDVLLPELISGRLGV